MSGTDKTNNSSINISDAKQWPGIDSRYRLIVVAALRYKQLLRGATPRIAADPRRHRHVSIALEEVKQGLIPFTIGDAESKEEQ
jgi:DNA-directed RNA polymerase omega subunit